MLTIHPLVRDQCRACTWRAAHTIHTQRSSDSIFSIQTNYQFKFRPIYAGSIHMGLSETSSFWFQYNARKKELFTNKNTAETKDTWPLIADNRQSVFVFGFSMFTFFSFPFVCRSTHTRTGLHRSILYAFTETKAYSLHMHRRRQAEKPFGCSSTFALFDFVCLGQPTDPLLFLFAYCRLASRSNLLNARATHSILNIYIPFCPLCIAGGAYVLHIQHLACNLYASKQQWSAVCWSAPGYFLIF